MPQSLAGLLKGSFHTSHLERTSGRDIWGYFSGYNRRPKVKFGDLT